MSAIRDRELLIIEAVENLDTDKIKECIAEYNALPGYRWNATIATIVNLLITEERSR